MEEVKIGREDLAWLVESAEGYLFVQADEYSNEPTDADRLIMLRMWKLLGKPMPEYFRRHCQWQESAG
jgi:hypothetical protein